MTNPQHTPGPWIVDGQDITTSEDTGFALIATINLDNPTSVCHANAALLAGAPELLTALCRLIYEAEKRAGVPQRFLAQARLVVNKATAQE